MTSEISSAQGTPPVAASTGGGYSGQVPGRVAATWVHHSERRPAAGFLHRPSQITIVTDYHGRVEATGKHIDEQMRGHVDVAALSMVVLYAARHQVPVPFLARWLLGLGIAATLTANMAQGWSHGPVGAVVRRCRAGGQSGGLV